MIKHLFISILTITTTSIFCGNLLAQKPIPGLFRTGINNDGVAQTPGSLELHYSMENSQTPQVVARHSLWVQPPAGSAWISLAGGNQSLPIATYTYKLIFDLSGFDQRTAKISGQIASDNSLTILINGINTGFSNISAPFQRLHPFSIDSGFVAGMNTLEFRVLNFAVGPSGLLVADISGEVCENAEDCGLVAYLPFNGNADDESGNGNHGTVSGATLTADRFGNPNSAFAFDGTNDFIRISSTPDLQGGSHPISVAVWFKADITSGNRPLVNKFLNASVKDWGIRIFDNLLEYTSERAQEDFRCFQSQGTVDANQWHFAAFVANEPILTLYWDGIKVGNCSNFVNHWAATNADVEIGRTGYAGIYYDGSIDDVRIYNRSLSSDEILQLYLENELPVDQDIVPPAAPQNLTAIAEPGRVTLAWNPNTEPDLLRYRIYRSTNQHTFTLRNSVPANTTTYVDAGLDPNTIYFYRITAVDSALNESGFSNEVSSFVPELADLEVSQVQAPPSAFSGQPIQINWTVTNTGNDGTKSPGWTDEILLSPSAVFDPQTAIVIKQVENFSALNASEAYANSITYTLPRGISGNYYIFVRTDRANREPETDKTDNQGISSLIQVELSPFPDLQVTAITVPANAFSGDTIQIGWTVQNNGTARTDGDNWYDTIFFSEDDTLDFDFIGTNRIRINETALGVVRRDGGLEASASYSGTVVLRLPHTIFGRHRIFVFTDIPGGGVQPEDGLIYEYNQFLNNDRSDTINIKLRPTPDLVVTSLGATTSIASLGEDITVQWTVKNQGAGEPFENDWQDIIYLSRTATFDPSAAFVLGTSLRSGGLKRDSTYTQSRIVRIPNGFAGENYFFVQTDFNNGVFEYQDDGNNLLTQGRPIVINTPDFEIRSVVIPSTANSGKNFEIVWNVINNGPGAVFSMAWNDRVYLSRQPIFNPDSATVIGAFSHSGALHKDSSYTVTRSFTLPNGVSGDYFVFVETNYDARVFENHAASNNRGRSPNAMRVQLSPWADLQVDSITTPDSLMAGGRLAVTWTAANRGVAAAEGTWSDRVYLSPGTTWNPNNATLLASAERTRGLEAGASYTQSRNVTLPTNLAGTYIITVQTDANNNVYEHTDEGNNLTHSSPRAIAAYPPSDLAVSDFVAPDSALSGSAITVHWTVTNIGPATTLSQSWSDQLYFSTDTQLDPNGDLLMATVTRSGALRSNESYTRQSSLTLANGFFGDYYLIVVSDAGGAVNDDDRSNNVTVSSKRIHIDLAPSPDLTITELRLPEQVNAGQPLLLTYTIANRGNGGLSNRNWYDAVYLSQNATLDNADVALAAQSRNLLLPANASYTDSIEVEMPGYASGAYFLIMKTDSRNEIYEHDAELNNVRIGSTTSTGGGDSSRVDPIDIKQPAPADLIISDVSIPANAIPGEEITISWTLKNIGENRATGRLRDAVYISADTLFQVEDPVFGVLTHHIDLPPDSSMQMSMKVNLAKLFRADAEGNLTEELPGLTPGKYHALVRTDIRRNIRESNTANNTLASAEVMDTDVPELRLGVPVVGTLTEGKKLYYRVNVDADMDLLLNLTSPVSNASNEIYVAYGRVPTATDYDFAGREAFNANQEMLVPTTKAGMYYIMLATQSSTIPSVEFMLLGKALPFSVFDITPDAGGSGGRVTTKIRGAGFRDSMAVYLKLSSDSLFAGRVLTQSNSVELKVRWDLKSVPVGEYDMIVKIIDSGKNSVSEIVLPDAFTVEPLVFNKVSLEVDGPDVIRRGSTVVYWVRVENKSNVDAHIIGLNATFPSDQKLRIESNKFFGRPVPDKILENIPLRSSGIQLGGIAAITAYAKNVQPGEKIEAYFYFDRVDLFEEMPLAISAFAMTKEDILLRELTAVTLLREEMLIQGPQSVHKEIWNFLSPDTTAPYFIQSLYETGLLSDDPIRLKTLPLVYDPNLLIDGINRFAQNDLVTCEFVAQGWELTFRLITQSWAAGGLIKALELGITLNPYVRAVLIGIAFADWAYDTVKWISCGPENNCPEWIYDIDGLTIGDPDGFFPTIAPIRSAISSFSDILDAIDLVLYGIIEPKETIANYIFGNSVTFNLICSAIRAAFDPNDITGSAGFGDERWITATQTLP